jgi:hypothetical protein
MPLGKEDAKNKALGKEEASRGTELQAKLKEKNEEIKRMRDEIKKAKEDAEMLKLNLQVRGIKGESLIPENMGTGGKPRPIDMKCTEHKRLIEWLAEKCDLSTKTGFIVPDPEVNVGGHIARLGHMVQWNLNVSGYLRLSAPIQFEKEIVDIIRKTKLGFLTEDDLNTFSDDWLLVTTDLVAQNVATPALFLIHKEHQAGIVVSAWPHIFAEPNLPGLGPPVSPPVGRFDANSFFDRESRNPSTLFEPEATPFISGEVTFTAHIFHSDDDLTGVVNRLHRSKEGDVLWTVKCEDGSDISKPVEELRVSFSLQDQFTLGGPFGHAVIVDPAPGVNQRWLVCGLVALALENGVPVQHNNEPTVATPSSLSQSSGINMSSGDHVEVKYKGNWLKGILQDVQGAFARVKCDIDDNGVMTVAPLNRLRPAQSAEAELSEGFRQC